MDRPPIALQWRELTIRQEQCVEIVKRLTSERGFAPTLREIAHAMNVNLPRAQHMVDVCCRKGALAKHPFTPRSIHVPRPADLRAEETADA